MLDYFIAAFSPLNVVLALAGVAAGTIIGSIPGLTATMAVAVLVPFTFAMAPESALILMGAIYTGAIYGGAYAAILLNTPGTPSAIATTFDGYPMAKRGDGDLAVTIACLSSVVGGLVGALALLFLAPPLARAALAFGPVEYFWLAIFGLSLISALSAGDFLKGMIAACFGLILAMIGISEISAEVRLTFGSPTLLGGIEVISALIGLYCVPVLIDLVATPERHLEAGDNPRGFRLSEAIATLSRNLWNLARSSAIGTMVGALPGAGGSIAGLVAYSEARRSARDRQTYGKGNPGGVIATESANNATVGGGLIPTLVLGIPGTPPDAVILGALLVQGVRTGPTLFESGASIVYTFIFGLLLATILMLPVGLFIGRFAYGAIVRAPKAALVPVVAFMTIIGAYAIRNSISDVGVMVVLGVIGWIAANRGFAVSPIVLGLILGRIAEQGFVQSWTIGAAIEDLPGQFFGRPLSIAIIALTAITFIYPFVPRLRAGRGPADDATAAVLRRQPANAAAKLREVLALGAFGAIAAVVIAQMAGRTAEAAVFPLTAAIAMAVFVLGALAKLAITGIVTEESAPGSFVRRAMVPLVMLVTVGLIPHLGFGASCALMGLALYVVADHQRQSLAQHALAVASVLMVIVGATYAFRVFLSVPLPGGALF